MFPSCRALLCDRSEWTCRNRLSTILHKETNIRLIWYLSRARPNECEALLQTKKRLFQEVV